MITCWNMNAKLFLTILFALVRPSKARSEPHPRVRRLRDASLRHRLELEMTLCEPVVSKEREIVSSHSRERVQLALLYGFIICGEKRICWTICYERNKYRPSLFSMGKNYKVSYLDLKLIWIFITWHFLSRIKIDDLWTYIVPSDIVILYSDYTACFVSLEYKGYGLPFRQYFNLTNVDNSTFNFYTGPQVAPTPLPRKKSLSGSCQVVLEARPTLGKG